MQYLEAMKYNWKSGASYGRFRKAGISAKYGIEDLHVTISIVATMLSDNDSIESVIQRSDHLLYKSKENGRNRITIG